MTNDPPEPSSSTVHASEATYCYRHPDEATRLRCSRCDRPICGRCAVPATVGQHCPSCVAEARRTSPTVRSTMAARSPAVLAIVVINVVFFLAQRIVPGLTIRLGAVPAAIAAGEWYRLLTPMLLHHPGNLLHILFNMIVLWIYGPYVEQALGTARFVAVYVVSGFCGGAVSFAFGPCQSLGVGASGAIFGVVGALLVHLYRRRRSSFVAGYLRDLTFFIGINLVFGFVFPGIDYLAHVGGLVAGATIGGGFDLDSGERKSGVAALTSLAVVGAGVALVAWRTGQGLCV